MKTAGELRAEADHLRDVARRVSDPRLLEAIRELIEELEASARDVENGAQD
jgi:hypothetical protein